MNLGAAKNLPVISKQVYNDTVPYGGFISQSIPAGTQYFAKDTIPDIMAVYSLGRVYIKDLKGQTEGDLQGTFIMTIHRKVRILPIACSMLTVRNQRDCCRSEFT
jgi:hypothetical protein